MAEYEATINFRITKACKKNLTKLKKRKKYKNLNDAEIIRPVLDKFLKSELNKSSK